MQFMLIVLKMVTSCLFPEDVTVIYAIGRNWALFWFVDAERNSD